MCNEIVGVNGDEGTPVPIPNTVVKLVYGDNTWLATAREDNSTPTSKAATKVAAFSFEGRHLRFLPSWDSRFPLFHGLAQTRDRRPLRKGERQRIFSTVFFVTCSQGQIPFCYTGRRVNAGATYSCCATR